jgi:hypothetical protein
MSGAHAYLPPSGAGEWVACAAWPLMNAMYPQDDTEESREGTAAHWVWEPHLSYGASLPAVGAFAPNGVPVSEAMLEGADLYVRTIDAALAATGYSRASLQVEQRVAIPYVLDYKFGHGFVDAFENWQCVDYLCGLVDDLARMYGQEPALFEQGLSVTIIVVQPRNYDSSGPVREWTVPAADLRAMWNKLKAAAERAVEPVPLATTGPQCENCPGRHACSANQRQGYRAVTLSRRSLPLELPAQALATELAILEDAQRDLEARISGLQADAEVRVKRGEAVPGYGLTPSVGREGWSVAPELAVSMAKMIGIDIAKPGALTPAQARKAGVPADVVASISGRPVGGMKLARIDDKNLRKTFG